MRHSKLALAALSVVLCMAIATGAAAQGPTDPGWVDIGKTLQSAPLDGGGYVRFNFPRSDIKLTVGDVSVAPSLLSTAWVGFSGTPAAADAMGDLVILASELPAVTKALAVANIDIMAIHNHIGSETPRLNYIHIHAMGNAADIARRLDGVFSVTAIPRPVLAATAAPVTIDTARVFDALGKRGKASGAVASLSFMLVQEPVTIGGMTVFPALAYGTPIVIQQVSPARAVATGDFSVTAAHVKPIVDALAAGGITATALHIHMVGAQPEVYYIHFWGDAPLPALLQGLKGALDAARR